MMATSGSEALRIAAFRFVLVGAPAVASSAAPPSAP